MVLAALLGLALAGCAQRPATASSDARLASLRPGLNCAPDPLPGQLPPVSAVVDSAGLLLSLAELVNVDDAVHGTVLLTLEFARDGTNILRDVVARSTSVAVADSVQRLVFAARRQVDEGDQRWGVRLEVELSESVGLRLTRRELCQPRLRDATQEMALTAGQPIGTRYRGTVRERVVQVRAHVNEMGLITSATIARGELPGGSLDHQLMQHLRQFLFHPATVDGNPTGAWIEIPIRVRG